MDVQAHLNDDKPYKISLKTASYLIGDAWEKVTMTTIKIAGIKQK